MQESLDQWMAEDRSTITACMASQEVEGNTARHEVRPEVLGARDMQGSQAFLRMRKRESANRTACRRGGESIAVMVAESRQRPK
ncbi:unnamed protein product [Boreogadus saida]